jgi:two-component system NarL family sensor kinase
VAEGIADRPSRREISAARVMLQVSLVAALVISLVAAGSVVLARRTAEREAINGATQATDLLADAVVQPALDDALLSGSPSAALARLDQVVRKQVLGHSVVRVKVWTPQGRIVYSDEPRLIGKTYPLGTDERGALTKPITHAEVTQLQAPENRYERGQGKLLEVYRPIWTPSGQPLLFETYTRYQAVAARTTQLWRGFAGIMVSSLLLLVILLLPVLWALLDRLRRGQRQRESLLQHAVDASAEERQRIAGTLHDGVVQELAATSFAVTAAADQADVLGQPQLAERIRSAAGTVRTSIGGLRSLLVDIYPPSLRAAGLGAALTDLVAATRSRDIEVRLDLPDSAASLGLDARGERLIFRVAQECLRNVARHAAASTVELRLRREGGTAILEVEDDGIGFDLETVRDAPAEGHFGLRLLADLAGQSGAFLRVATAPGAGTRWRLEVPVT